LFLGIKKNDAYAGKILSKRLRKNRFKHVLARDLTFFNFWEVLLGSLLFV